VHIHKVRGEKARGGGGVKHELFKRILIGTLNNGGKKTIERGGAEFPLGRNQCNNRAGKRDPGKAHLNRPAEEDPTAEQEGPGHRELQMENQHLRTT